MYGHSWEGFGSRWLPNGDDHEQSWSQPLLAGPETAGMLRLDRGGEEELPTALAEKK